MVLSSPSNIHYNNKLNRLNKQQNLYFFYHFFYNMFRLVKYNCLPKRVNIARIIYVSIFGCSIEFNS